MSNMFYDNNTIFQFKKKMLCGKLDVIQLDKDAEIFIKNFPLKNDDRDAIKIKGDIVSYKGTQLFKVDLKNHKCVMLNGFNKTFKYNLKEGFKSNTLSLWFCNHDKVIKNIANDLFDFLMVRYDSYCSVSSYLEILYSKIDDMLGDFYNDGIRLHYEIYEGRRLSVRFYNIEKNYYIRGDKDIDEARKDLEITFAYTKYANHENNSSMIGNMFFDKGCVIDNIEYIMTLEDRRDILKKMKSLQYIYPEFYHELKDVKILKYGLTSYASYKENILFSICDKYIMDGHDKSITKINSLIEGNISIEELTYQYIMYKVRIIELLEENIINENDTLKTEYMGG